MKLIPCSSLLLTTFLCLSGLHGFNQTLSLDGTWEIVFDPDNAGREAGWHEDDVFQSLEDRVPIQVPSAWELIKQDYEGVAFYRHEFDVPADWADSVVRLQFGAVNYICEVWVNDEDLGAHEGGFTPFEFRVDRLLKPGETNVLTLRVVGPLFFGDKKIDGIGALETPQWRGGITGGVWQSVQLVATGPVYVEDVDLVPHYASGEVDFQIQLDHTGILGTETEVSLQITERDNPSNTVATYKRILDLRPGLNHHAWASSIPGARPWSPDDPFLYEAKLTVSTAGELSDQWSHRFGLREFTIQDDQFVLNGEPVYLKATFFEGLYPNGIAYPDSEEMARQEIRLAKEAGFNMIRPWRRPPAPLWLDLADEMGVLVVGSPALECMRLPLSTPYLPARVENEIRQAVLRDRNRTCVVQWELFNELHRPILMQMMRPMAMMVRDLDSTRLILDESGGWPAGANMYLPDDYEPTKFNDIHNYSGAFINERRYNAYLSIGMTEEERAEFGYTGPVPGRNVVPGLMSYLSELGYGSLPNMPLNNARFQEEGNPLTPAYRYYQRMEADQRRDLEASGFDYLYPDFEAFCLEQQSIHGAANKRMIEAVRSNPNVQGYCIHALTGGDWIFGAGLLDIWRNPKTEAYTQTKAANQPRIVSIRMIPRNVYAEKGGRLSVTGINDLIETEAKVQVQAVSADGKVVLNKTFDEEWAHGISTLFEEQLDTSHMQGTYEVRVQVSGPDNSELTSDTFHFDVFQSEELVRPQTSVAVLDLNDSLKPKLRTLGVRFTEFDSATPMDQPVFVTHVQPTREAAKKRFRDLVAWIKAGGTAVYISGPDVRFRRVGNNQIHSDTIPFSAEVEHAQGLWTCIPHLVKEHPIFEGLPSDRAMREIYENVWAPQTLRNLSGEAVVASVGFDWFSYDHKLHYRGPGKSWWGTDLGIVHVGKGKCVVSMLQIVPNLGKDPVADKLLFNMIGYLAP